MQKLNKQLLMSKTAKKLLAKIEGAYWQETDTILIVIENNKASLLNYNSETKLEFKSGSDIMFFTEYVRLWRLDETKLLVRTTLGNFYAVLPTARNLRIWKIESLLA